MRRLVHLWRQASTRDRRALALGGAITLAAWMAVRGGPWIAGEIGLMHERARAAQRGLASARATLDQEPLLRDSLATRAQRLVRWAPRLFAGGTASEAHADLSGWLTGLAAARHVRLGRLDVGGDSSASVFTQLTVRVEAEGDVRGIVGWLAALEGGEKLVRVTALRVSAPAATDPAARTERLRVEVTLLGWAATGRSGEGT